MKLFIINVAIGFSAFLSIALFAMLWQLLGSFIGLEFTFEY